MRPEADVSQRFERIAVTEVSRRTSLAILLRRRPRNLECLSLEPPRTAELCTMDPAVAIRRGDIRDIRAALCSRSVTKRAQAGS